MSLKHLLLKYSVSQTILSWLQKVFQRKQQDFPKLHAKNVPFVIYLLWLEAARDNLHISTLHFTVFKSNLTQQGKSERIGLTPEGLKVVVAMSFMQAIGLVGFFPSSKHEIHTTGTELIYFI